MRLPRGQTELFLILAIAVAFLALAERRIAAVRSRSLSVFPCQEAFATAQFLRGEM